MDECAYVNVNLLYYICCVYSIVDKTMNIREIYAIYDIPFPLQQHMIRVASVCVYIGEHRCHKPIDKKSVVTAALLHDLGNIVKMDFSLHPEGYGHSMDYRQQKKQWVIEKYWSCCDQVTIAWCRELDIDEQVIDIILHMGIESYQHHPWSWERQIVRYADMRVDPRWITSMEQRMRDGHKRYAPLGKDWTKEPVWSTLMEHAYAQEQLLFSWTALAPEMITELSTKLIQEHLRHFVL